MGMDAFGEIQFPQAGKGIDLFMGKAARFIGAVLLLATVSLAQAAVESVPPVTLWCDGESGICTYSTDIAAAQAQAATYNIYKAPRNPGQITMYIVSCDSYGVCLHGIGPGPFTYGYPTVYIRSIYPACPVPTINPTVLYNYSPARVMCERTVQDCPIHSSGTFPNACVCDTGYKVDPAGTICVPVSNCPIPGLTPLTDPVAIGFENGNRWRPDLLTSGVSGYQTKLACVQKGIRDRGGSSVGTSAYRPTQYQQHLFEIVQKDAKLNADYLTANPGCQALRDEITRAMGPPPGHGLKRKQKIAKPGTSRHESGTAFDVTPSGLTDAQLAPVYVGCGVSHTAVSGEPWHVQ